MSPNASLAVPLLALGISFVNPCSQPADFKAPAPTEDDEVFEVETAYPEFASTPHAFDVDGTIDESAVDFVTANLDGELEELSVDTGDWVREGDVVARVSNTELLDELDLKRARLKEYQARLKSARGRASISPNPDRPVTNEEVMFLDEEPAYQSVAKKTYGVAAADPPKSLKELVEVLEAMTDKLMVETEKMEKRLDQTDHKSPVTGVVLDRFFTKGNKVTRQDKIIAVARTDPMTVSFRLPQEVANFVDKHSPVTITPEDAKELSGEGTVSFIAPDVDPATKSIEVRASFANTDGRLKGGQKARVKVTTGKLDRTLVLPERALEFDGDKRYLYIVFGNQVRRTEVETGRRLGEGTIEVYAGDVRVDDPIVIRRPVDLKDQSFVRIVSGNP